MKLTKQQLKAMMVSKKLFLSDKGITEIEAFPKNVKEIWLDNNMLNSIPELPDSVTTIILRGNPLQQEPVLPKSVLYADLTCTGLDEIYFDIRNANDEEPREFIGIGGESLTDFIDDQLNLESDWIEDDEY